VTCPSSASLVAPCHSRNKRFGELAGRVALTAVRVGTTYQGLALGVLLKCLESCQPPPSKLVFIKWLTGRVVQTSKP